MSKSVAKPKKKRHSQYAHPNKVYQEWYGCDVSTITRYKQRGLPLDDRDKMRDILAAQKNAPAQDDDDLDEADLPVDQISQAEAKRRKTVAEYQKIALQVEVERGKYELKESVIEAGYALGANVGSALDKLSADLPALLLGLTESSMSTVIRRETDKVRQMLSDQISKLAKKRK
jgi:hypothetical protein